MIDLATAGASLGVALAAGFLIGLEREQADARGEGDDTGESFGGVRTFPLLALIGALAVLTGQQIGSWFVGLAFFGIAGWIGIYYFVTSRNGHLGLTTEAAGLVAFFCGVLAAQGALSVAFAVAIATTGVLALKDWLHGAVRKMTMEETFASLKLLVVAFVVIPLLPDHTYGVTVPAELVPAFAGGQALSIAVINPRKIGWLIMLIAALGYSGFISGRLLGARKGLGLTAFLGGLVSSTAVTLTFAGRLREKPELLYTGVAAILLASTTMFVRVLIEVAAVHPPLLPALVKPIGAMALAGVVVMLFFWFRRSDAGDDDVELKNPFRLGEAVRWGILFAAVLFVAEVARLLFGEQGLYVSGVLAGLTDVDAITLSMASLAAQPETPLEPRVAVTTITLAAFANTLTKGTMALVVGGRALGGRVLGAFGVVIAAGVAALLLA